jgi:hypothetical protein
VYLIIGDPFLTRPVHRQLIAALLPPENRDLNWEQVDGEKEEVPTLIERLRTYPLFPGPKVVSVKNLWLLAPQEDRKVLWEKAREAWAKGEDGRSRRLLARLWAEAGVSLKGLGGQDAGQRRSQCLQALGDLHQGAAPEWLQKALDRTRRPPHPKNYSARPFRRGCPPGMSWF